MMHRATPSEGLKAARAEQAFATTYQARTYAAELQAGTIPVPEGLGAAPPANIA